MKTIPLCTESLWHRYRSTKAIATRNQIARQNDRLAQKIAYRMSGQSAEPVEDLIQIARIGLLKAIDRFNPNDGVAFSSFAVPYIRGEIQHFHRDHFGSIKIPRRAFEDAGKVNRLVFRLESAGRPGVDHIKVAAALGMSAEKWGWVSSAVKRKQTAQIDDLQLADDIDEEDSSNRYASLKRAIAHLPKLKRECVQEFWFQGLTEGAIAKRHKLTLVVVQNLLSEAFEQLKLQLTEEECHA